HVDDAGQDGRRVLGRRARQLDANHRARLERAVKEQVDAAPCDIANASGQARVDAVDDGLYDWLGGGGVTHPHAAILLFGDGLLVAGRFAGTADQSPPKTQNASKHGQSLSTTLLRGYAEARSQRDACQPAVAGAGPSGAPARKDWRTARTDRRL